MLIRLVLFVRRPLLRRAGDVFGQPFDTTHFGDERVPLRRDRRLVGRKTAGKRSRLSAHDCAEAAQEREGQEHDGENGDNPRQPDSL